MIKKWKIFNLPLLLALSACSQTLTKPPQLTSSDIKAEAKRQELFIAAEHQRQESYVNSVNTRIAQAASVLCPKLGSDASTCRYKINIEPDQDINAYATGNAVTITTAMLDFISSDHELAMIIGHEYAHNILSHTSYQNFNTGKIAEGFFDAFVYLTQMGIMGDIKADGNAANHTSISQEKEADYVGLYLSAMAGYDIRVAPQFWRRMSVRHPDAIYSTSTHPTNPERTVALEKAIQEINAQSSQGQGYTPVMR
ncbi:MAG: M48 family metalloprotease [Alphaproteobacteria bacterium]|nr:M48 family metalloprotease [Alphaproteobacteria bacterium]